MALDSIVVTAIILAVFALVAVLLIALITKKKCCQNEMDAEEGSPSETKDSDERKLNSTGTYGYGMVFSPPRIEDNAVSGIAPELCVPNTMQDPSSPCLETISLDDLVVVQHHIGTTHISSNI